MVYDRFPGTRFSGMYQFFVPTLVIRDPDLLKQITVKDFDHFTDLLSHLYHRMLILCGLIMGQRWHDMGVNPKSVLHQQQNESDVPIDERIIFEKRQRRHNYVFEMKNVFTRFGNDVIATAAFGISVNSLDKPNNEFYLMGKEGN
ncbi:hypothetical protein NQ317_001065 [Molorchus minor]|uniref:Uncharacterized protein n=1 Tax=Molorchus minor TaxID=1323400 RepID=A0ABQ9IRL4_9CUCU|nr:hypothetical protein NQ317_001065 [Molorchus minor]